jgi:putative spermidine/putrescine transport system ATP-binding protein
MSGVTLKNLRKNYGDVAAVDDVSICIRPGELLALLGPSGCGKTTTLRAIAGFVQPTSGTVHFGERDVTRVPVHHRNVGMVFQGYALFPHLTVAKNVEFGLRVRRWDKERVHKRVGEMLDWVQLRKMSERRPKELSGGQQQRVAVARAMAIEPDVLLLDEPFSALDAKLRLQMRTEIRELQQQAAITSVFVTHDQEEAMAIADRIGVMNQGKVEQMGSAEDLYKRPVSRFVAGFIGKCNFIEGRVTGPGRFETASGHALQFPGPHAPGAAALCLRPEHAVLKPPGADNGNGNTLAVTVNAVTYLGPATEYDVVTDAGDKLLVTAASSGAAPAGQKGSRLALTWRADDTFVVD